MNSDLKNFKLLVSKDIKTTMISSIYIDTDYLYLYNDDEFLIMDKKTLADV